MGWVEVWWLRGDALMVEKRLFAEAVESWVML